MEFEKHSGIVKYVESLSENRVGIILSDMLKNDNEYKILCGNRAEASVKLRESLAAAANELFEKYSDAVFAQELYELNALYRQAAYDVVDILAQKGLLKDNHG